MTDTPEQIEEQFRDALTRIRERCPTLIVDLIPQRDHIELAQISTPPDQRGRGFADEALDCLFALCDAASVELRTSPYALDDPATGALTDRQLSDWYVRRGFDVKGEGNYLIRKPRLR